MATDLEMTPGPLNDLTAFQRDLLAIVGKLDEPHGLLVKEKMELAYGVQDVQHGRLYPNLTTLSEMGLIEKGEKDARTNYYAITRRGRRELAAHLDWMDLWSAPSTEEGYAGP